MSIGDSMKNVLTHPAMMVLMALITIVAAVFGILAYTKVQGLNLPSDANARLLPATTAGNGADKILVGSTENGPYWTDAVTVDANGTAAAGANGFAFNPVGGASARVNKSAAATENTLSSFASTTVVPTVYDRLTNKTSGIVNNSSDLKQFITKSASDDAPVCKLSGFLQFGTKQSTVMPGISGLDFYAMTRQYGTISFVNGRTSTVAGNVTRTWCVVENNGITFWEAVLNTTTGVETIQELHVNDTSTASTGNLVRIAMEITYPINLTPATSATASS